MLRVAAALVGILALCGSAHAAAAYVSGDGHEYTLRCTADGYELTSKYPVSRAVGTGAGTRYVTGKEKLYLGRSCDASHKLYGTGSWCWANGGFLATFPEQRFGFPRQELFCEPERDYSQSCQC